MRGAAVFTAGWLVLSANAPCQRPDSDTAAACGRCHTTVHEEWRESAHAHAFVDPVFQHALAGRRRPEQCMPCHAPEGVLERLGRMPRLRAAARHDGVDCASCHRRGEAVHGPAGTPTSAHATVANPAFDTAGSSALCTSCHDLRIGPVLALGREYAASSRRADGESCVSCHMESVRRASAVDPDTKVATPVKSGRSHRLLGPRDPEFAASAFLLRIERTAAGHALFVGNGAGHGVPGLVDRRFAFRLAWLDRAGKPLHTGSFVVSWQDRLLADEEQRHALAVVATAVALRVQVDHHLADKMLATVIDRTLELP